MDIHTLANTTFTASRLLTHATAMSSRRLGLESLIALARTRLGRAVAKIVRC